MSDKTFTWDLVFITEDPDPDTGLVRWTGEYINDTRQSLTERLIDEHVWDINEIAPQNDMGAHKQGSAKSYYEDLGPTFRPDGVTSLDADDAGRLWFDYVAGQIKGWNGTAWVNLSAQGIGTILRWQNDAQYSQQEIVEYSGVLWSAQADPPTLGVPPSDPEWTIFVIEMPDVVRWFSFSQYQADDCVFWAGLWWVAVAPVYQSEPGLVPGEWAALEMETVSIADGAITNPKLSLDAVDTPNILDGKVTTAKIADLNVTTDKINTGAVTHEKMDLDSVSSINIIDGSILTVDIADANVTLAKLNEDARGIYNWQTTYTYSQDEIVAYDGTWWKANVAVPVVGVAPVIGSGDWLRFTDMTTETVIDTASVDAGYRDHTIFSDTSTNPNYTVTLPDGYSAGDKITVAAFGGGEVVVDGSGLTDQTQTDNAIEYLWSGTAWFPLGGGSGGGTALDLGEVTWLASPETTALPEGKLVCDGTLQLIADYPALFGRLGITWGGDGITTFGIPDFRSIYPGAVGINGVLGNDNGGSIGDYLPEQFSSHIHSMPSHFHDNGSGVWDSYPQLYPYGSDNPGNLGGGQYSALSGVGSGVLPHTETVDPGDTNATGDADTRPASAIGRWLIQAEEPAPQEVNAVVVDVTIGSTRWWGSDTIDQYDLLCDGQSVLVATYPELFAIIGYAFGGSGANFNVPNFEGIYPGAKGSQLINGRTKGDPTSLVGDYLEDEFQDHGHTQKVSPGAGNANTSDAILYFRSGRGGDGAHNNQIDGSGNNQLCIVDPLEINGNGVPRVKDHNEVSRLIGNWVIRALQPAAYVLRTIEELVSVVVADTTLADYDGSVDLPADAPNGFTVMFVNAGSGGNHIIGLPNLIELGDNKSLRFTKMGSVWYYEDTIIDEYSDLATGTALGTGATVYTTKRSGGRMIQEVTCTSVSGTGTKIYIPIETFVTLTGKTGVVDNEFTGVSIFTYRTDTGDYIWTVSSDSGVEVNQSSRAIFTGRWKTGA